MRTFPFIRRTTLALSFALFLTPAASSAQVAANDCTAGSGFYSCDFKDETGAQFPSVPMNVFFNQSNSTIIIDEEIVLSCACGLQGSVNGKDPLKKNNQVLCASTNFNPIEQSALAGQISGNPTTPASLKFKGQFQFLDPFNSTASRGFLFDCNRQGNFTR
jgi:hypothetical protein